ncbi:TRAP transporter substrate-binding protein DctP [Salinisphaera aquimarina]|uniref:TRAP transporter substrate-binding protein DctP n=1 Tax=Salinisphaera aquimarina TaxID=2094031 RepID=A0ABV7EQJ8_9GAMM
MYNTAKRMILMALLLTVVQTASATDMVMTNEVATSHWKTQYMKEVGEAIKKKTDGEINPIVFPSGQIYSDQDALAALGTGAVQMVWPVSVRLETIDQRAGVLSLPFTLKTADMQKACYRQQVSDLLTSFVDKRNLKVLTLLRAADLIFLFGDKNIDSLQDMHGVKVRVIGGKVYLATMQATGANPISMAASEMSTALAQGTIDGVLSSAAGWADMLGTSAQYGFYVPGFELATYAVVVDKGWFDALSDKDAAIVRNSVEDIADDQWTSTVKKDQKLIEEMESKGSTYTVADDAEIQRWRDKMQPVIDRFDADHPGVVEKFKALDSACQ